MDSPLKRGPKEERVKIEGPWEEAVEKALRKPPPPKKTPNKKTKKKKK